MRVLLDTNILARAAAGPPGLANELVVTAARPEHTLLLSPFIFWELNRVLRYERLARIHGLDESGIGAYIGDLLAVAEMVLPPDKPTRVVADDPEDDPIIATAIVGRADFLCTRDRHLLRPEVVAFCQMHRVAIVNDLELMVQIG